LGFHAGFIRPNPYNGRVLHDADYEPPWIPIEKPISSASFHNGS